MHLPAYRRHGRAGRLPSQLAAPGARGRVAALIMRANVVPLVCTVCTWWSGSPCFADKRIQIEPEGPGHPRGKVAYTTRGGRRFCLQIMEPS